MIDVIRQKISEARSYEEKFNKAREFLQLLVLKIIFDRKYFNNIAFVGGTALRVLYNHKRFSEDLDFSLVEKKGYSFRSLAGGLKNDLKQYGLAVEIPVKDKNTVNSSMMKFPELLNELGLSNIKGQKLAVKLEVDTNPPKGWKLALTPVSSSFVFAVSHFDLPSLFATKIHACFFRKYSKGRDFYDLAWYFGRRIKPNYELLNNAIRQTEGDMPQITQENIKKFFLERINKLDFGALKKDVERFLEDKNELSMLDKSIMAGIVKTAEL